MKVVVHRPSIPVFCQNTSSRKLLNPHFRTIRRLPLASSFQDFNLPELEGDVEYYQRELNGRFNSEGLLLDFNDQSRLSKDSSFLYDRSHWGRLRISGKGALEFLNNRTTNEFRGLVKGTGVDTLFLQSKGKIIDLVTAFVLGNGVLLILSPNVQDGLMEQLNKFIFPGDEVELVDVRSQTRVFSLIGTKSHDLLRLLKVQDKVLDGVYGTNEIFNFQDGPVIAAKGNELEKSQGFTLIVDDSIAGDMYKNLVDAGGLPIGSLDWERLRVSRGRPGLQTEVQQASNPFEVGLFHAVSLNKGCFLGQESISRIYTKNTIRRQLWGIQLQSLDASISPGVEIMREGRSVGTVTSSPVELTMEDSTQVVCLGFLRCKLDKESVDWRGTEVEIEGIKGTVRELEYTSVDFINGVGAPIASTKGEDTSTQTMDKEKKLQEMQARLDAFMKQQKEQG